MKNRKLVPKKASIGNDNLDEDMNGDHDSVRRFTGLKREQWKREAFLGDPFLLFALHGNREQLKEQTEKDLTKAEKKLESKIRLEEIWSSAGFVPMVEAEIHEVNYIKPKTRRKRLLTHPYDYVQSTTKLRMII
jgi:hypothetical protein